MWIQKQIYCVLWKISSLSICTLPYLIQSPERRRHSRGFRGISMRMYTIKSGTTIHSAASIFLYSDVFFSPPKYECWREPLYLYGIINLIIIIKKIHIKTRNYAQRRKKAKSIQCVTHFILFCPGARSLSHISFSIGYYSWISKRFVVVALRVSIVCCAENMRIFFSYFPPSLVLIHLYLCIAARSHIGLQHTYRQRRNETLI